MSIASKRAALVTQLTTALAGAITRTVTVLPYEPPLPYIPGEGQGYPLLWVDVAHAGQELIFESGAIVGSLVTNPWLFRLTLLDQPAADQDRTVAAIKADRDAIFDAMLTYYKIPSNRAIADEATHVGIPLTIDPIAGGDYTSIAGQLLLASEIILGLVPC